jgi:hypothetical protein
MTPFKNYQKLGSFGEFCYKKFAIAKGLPIEKVGFLEYDFNVATSHKVDVKTTQTKKIKFTGKRVRADISYDLVRVADNEVIIYPDLTSPLIKFSGSVIGATASLYDEWLLNKSIKIKTVSTPNEHKIRRNVIQQSIRDVFPNKRVRFVFRGSVSKTRWSGSPDNLPGRTSKTKNTDMTVFVQMLTVGDMEEINRIYLFYHDSFKKIKMKIPDRRQVKKGIFEVIDFESYELNFPSFIFNSFEELKKSILINRRD